MDEGIGLFGVFYKRSVDCDRRVMRLYAFFMRLYAVFICGFVTKCFIVSVTNKNNV